MLDGKEVDQKQRSFLLRLEMQKAKRREGRGRGGGAAAAPGARGGQALGPAPHHSGRPMPFEGDSGALAPPQQGR